MEPRQKPVPHVESDEYFPIAEVAKLFPIGHQRLRKLVKDGEIPAAILPPASDRPGRNRILIRPREVQTWLRNLEQRQENPEDAQ